MSHMDRKKRIRMQFLLFFISLTWPFTTGTSYIGKASAQDFDRAKTNFYRKISALRWIAYSPSTFDPSGKKPLLKSNVEADLEVLQRENFHGIVTYSCSPVRVQPADVQSLSDEAVGTADIPRIARQMGFRGIIAGVWNPTDENETAAVMQLAKLNLIDAVCVGNEGLDVRYDWNQLKQAMQAIRVSTGLPVTTTEQIEDYSLSGLSDPEAVDWLFPNIHPVFQNITDPLAAARWTISRAQDLRKHADSNQGGKRLPLLIKETGWPTQGFNHHSETTQKKFWEVFAGQAREAGLRYVVFEAFDQPWKHENYMGKDVGIHWGVNYSNREAKTVVNDEIGERLYIYKDENVPGGFIPSGWMPGGDGIAQNTAERDNPHSGQHCLRLYCQLSEQPWLGIYFLLEGKWEPEHQFNAFSKLGARMGEHIKCRFWARSEKGAVVQFKVGGVVKGKIRDTIVFPVASGWIDLQKDWRRYEIDLTGKDLSSVIGAFVWVVDRLHNDNKDVSFDLDTIYYVKTK